MNNETIIELIQDDITTLQVDAIVNAANSTLLGGGGVDGAIHKAGCETILKECKKIIAEIGKCEVGNAVITTAGNLLAKFVIHTVGPVWQGGNANEAELLTSAYRNSLELAIANNIETIAFPNISTGIFSFPKQKAAEIAIKTIKEYLKTTSSFEKITFVCFDIENYNIYKDLLNKNSFAKQIIL